MYVMNRQFHDTKRNYPLVPGVYKFMAECMKKDSKNHDLALERAVSGANLDSLLCGIIMLDSLH